MQRVMAAGKEMQVPRAQRFPFHIPLQYRKSGMPDWHECKTVNISRTGILFQTDQIVELDANLEIRVQFPSQVTLSCQGSVVRTPEAACAVRIHHSKIVPEFRLQG